MKSKADIERGTRGMMHKLGRLIRFNGRTVRHRFVARGSRGSDPDALSPGSRVNNITRYFEVGPSPLGRSTFLNSLEEEEFSI